MSQNDSKLCEVKELCERFGLKRFDDNDAKQLFELGCQYSFVTGIAAVFADDYERHEYEQVSLLEFVDQHWYPHNKGPMPIEVVAALEEATAELKARLGRGY